MRGHRVASARRSHGKLLQNRYRQAIAPLRLGRKLARQAREREALG